MVEEWAHLKKNACCTVASVDTSKVLHVEVLSKWCSACKTIKDKVNKITAHEPNCLKNYDGTSGGMETVAAVSVCQRSLPN